MRNAAILGALSVTLALFSGAVFAQDSGAVLLPSTQTAPIEAQTPSATEAKANIIVLYANNSGKGIDERIGDMPQLKQPPFSAYNTYELVTRKELPFSQSTPGVLSLPNKSTFKILLNKYEAKSRVYDVQVSIDKPKIGANIKAKKNEIFFIAGPKYKKGILVLGIKVLPK